MHLYIYIYGRGSAICFCQVFQCYAFSQCHRRSLVFSSRSLVFSGLVLLKWFTKSFKFGKGFNDNELFGDDTGNIALNRTAGQPFTAFFMETFCSFKENWALIGHF